MGFGGISLWQLLIVLVIVLLLFGTKKLKGMGSDLGGAIKGFKKAMNDDDAAASDAEKDAAQLANEHDEKATVDQQASSAEKQKH